MLQHVEALFSNPAAFKQYLKACPHYWPDLLLCIVLATLEGGVFLLSVYFTSVPSCVKPFSSTHGLFRTTQVLGLLVASLSIGTLLYNTEDFEVGLTVWCA